MIITLIRANFSANNIGTLNTLNIFTNLGEGCSYIGPTSVERNESMTATINIANNYLLDNITVYMNGVEIFDYTIQNKTITINITSVTGTITINTVSHRDLSIVENLWKFTRDEMEAIMTDAKYRTSTGAIYSPDAPSEYDLSHPSTDKIYINGHEGTYSMKLYSGKTYRW
jgi:hypothetical protein